MQFQWLLFAILSFSLAINAQMQSQEVDRGASVRLMCNPKSNRPDVQTTYEWFDPGNRSRGSNIHFEITNFSEANVGIYTCKATQIIDGQIATTQMSVQVRLRDSVEVTVPQSYVTYAGGIVFLSCSVKAKDATNYKFEWITPTGERQATSSYFKNLINKDQSGVYICRATRLQDNQVFESRSFVTVRDLPIKIDKISGTMTFGETVQLKCEMDKPSTDNKVFTSFSYTWFNPKNEIISNDQIVSVKFDDLSKFGTYQCRITAASMNPPYSQNQFIEIRYAGSSNTGDGGRNPGGQTRIYTGSFTNSPKIVRYFDPLELNCGINPPVSWVTYQIYFNEKLVSDTSRYVVPRLGKEHLGIYQCIISGRDPSSGQTVDLRSTFTIQPEFKMGSKIELTEPPGPQIFVRAGDKRELHCEIGVNTGLQGRNAEWYFNGKLITPNDYNQYNIQVLPRLYVSIMILKSIQQPNEGKYECKVKGETKEAYLLVMARSRTIEVNPNEETRKVGDGRAVEFHCRIGGYRTKNRDVIWTFMSKETGQVTQLESNRWSRSDDSTADETSFIILQQAELSDTGTYICTEPETRDTARGILNVIGDLRIVVTPPIIKLRTGQTATFQCYVLNAGRSPEHPDFFLANGGRAADSQRTTVEKLEAGKVQLTYRAVTINDNGTKFTCRKGRSSQDVLVIVEPVCSSGSRLCRNGECINSGKFCDSKRDCADGSDEDQEFCKQCDPLSKTCEFHNGQNPTNRIFQAHWACDGEDDCGNGFDESKCYGSVLDCGGLTYRCNDGKVIPKAFLCDKDTDCTNGDDENRCTQPTIIEDSPESYKVNARKGETVTLTCQVSGYPLPKIIWRHNWGCLLNERRMVVTESYRNCATTVSVLTISEFQNGDDGIYNCEALSGGKRAWSKDYILMMNFRT